MILILNKEDDYDQCANSVIDWLIHYDEPFMCLSLKKLLSVSQDLVIDVDRMDITIDGYSLRKNISIIFYRRFFNNSYSRNNFPAIYQRQLENELKEEYGTMGGFIFEILKEKVWLPDFKSLKVNKLSALNTAKELGFRIPVTKVINNKEGVKNFFEEVNGRLIGKMISSNSFYSTEEYSHVVFTYEITEQQINRYPDNFMPSLFQEKIEYEYEIRTFFLNDSIYPVAIINPSIDKAIDRKINNESGSTHFIPYLFPDEVRSKIIKVMNKLNLLTGSLDIVYKSGKYYFLEVNPIGQFLFESQKCNLLIEKEIADYLININKKYENRMHRVSV